MSVLSSLSPRDLALLSAYLDDELRPAERRRLEARLKRDPSLRAALRHLEQTRAVLRRAPGWRAPRAFVLPASAPRPIPAWQPLMRWVSMAAAILLALVMVGEVGLNALGVQRVAAPSVEAPMMAAAPPEKAAPPAGETAEEQTAAPEAPSPAATYAAIRGAERLDGSSVPEATPSPTLPAPMPTIAPPSPLPAVSSWRWLEMGLALLAVLSGVLAWWGGRWR